MGLAVNGGLCGAEIIGTFAFTCSLTLGHHGPHWNSALAHIINEHQKPPPRETLTVGGLRSALKGIHPDCVVEVSIGGDGYGDGIWCEWQADEGVFSINVEPYEIEKTEPEWPPPPDEDRLQVQVNYVVSCLDRVIADAKAANTGWSTYANWRDYLTCTTFVPRGGQTWADAAAEQRERNQGGSI